MISIEICDVLSPLSRGHIFPETLVTAMPKTRDANVERNRELVLDGKRIKKRVGAEGKKLKNQWKEYRRCTHRTWAAAGYCKSAFRCRRDASKCSPDPDIRSTSQGRWKSNEPQLKIDFETRPHPRASFLIIKRLHVYMYVCMYRCTCIYIYIYIHTHICICM